MAEIHRGAKVTVWDRGGTVVFVYGGIRLKKYIWRQCAIPLLAANVGTLSIAASFSLKMRALFIRP